jgi:hypothetical protein
VQVGSAGGDFDRLGVAVSRGAALDDVRDEDLLPPQPHPLLNDVIEETAGPPDEGTAETVLVGTGTLAHEHEVRGRIPFAEDGVAAFFVEGAAAAAGHLGGYLFQGGGRMGGGIKVGAGARGPIALKV